MELVPDTIGMGTTIVLVWIINEKAYIALCGDSRCYVFNPKRGLKCLSKDHSYVQELIDKGDITPQKSFNHPKSNIITRWLGNFFAEPEITVYDIHKHDQFLLCSDGLYNNLTDSEIHTILSTNELIEDKAKTLIACANANGGSDNIAVVLWEPSND
jgi:protein phosphatase